MSLEGMRYRFIFPLITQWIHGLFICKRIYKQYRDGFRRLSQLSFFLATAAGNGLNTTAVVYGYELSPTVCNTGPVYAALNCQHRLWVRSMIREDITWQGLLCNCRSKLLDIISLSTHECNRMNVLFHITDYTTVKNARLYSTRHRYWNQCIVKDILARWTSFQGCNRFLFTAHLYVLSFFISKHHNTVSW